MFHRIFARISLLVTSESGRDMAVYNTTTLDLEALSLEAEAASLGTAIVISLHKLTDHVQTKPPQCAVARAV
jgi:hypothetical protein